MRHCCDWWGWSMQKLEPIERLNIGRPNMVKQGLMYLKQSWKWMLTRLWKNANIGLATPKNRTGTSAVGGRAHNHHATYQWCVWNYSYFYIPLRAEGAVKLSSKEIDKNGTENQTKTRWVWSGRHDENRMGCGRHEWWEKVLWQGGKFPRLLLGVMNVDCCFILFTYIMIFIFTIFFFFKYQCKKICASNLIVALKFSCHGFCFQRSFSNA